MDKIRPCLWFDSNAEEAVRHYLSIFGRSRVVRVSRYGEGAPLPQGTALVIAFELEGQGFLALNGGPMHGGFTPAISLSVDCDSQEEIDRLWAALSAGGAPGRCGWVKDRYGLSWQIVPTRLSAMMADGDGDKVARVTSELLTMDKLDLARLTAAFEGR